MRKRQRVGAYRLLTGPGIKPRRVPLGGLAASSRHDLDRLASDGKLCGTAIGRDRVRVEAGLGVFGEKNAN